MFKLFQFYKTLRRDTANAMVKQLLLRKMREVKIIGDICCKKTIEKECKNMEGFVSDAFYNELKEPNLIVNPLYVQTNDTKQFDWCSKRNKIFRSFVSRIYCKLAHNFYSCKIS